MTCGVLTASDSSIRYWSSLAATAISCQQWELPLTVTDHGLLDPQKTWLRARGVSIMPADAHEQPHIAIPAGAATTTVAPPLSWWKPFVCAASPYKKTIWVDADAVLLRPHGLFDGLPWVSLIRAPGSFKRFYGDFVQGCHSDLDGINSGVFAWAAGESFIQEWVDATRTFVADPSCLAKTKLRDQTTFVITLAKCDVSNRPRVIKGVFNQPPLHRDPIPAHVHDVPSYLRRMYPDTRVLHWYSKPKAVLNPPKTMKCCTTTACMATHKHRRETSVVSLHSIAKQVDVVRLYCNDCKPPEDLPSNVQVFHAPMGDLGDAGKFYNVEELSGYVFTVDDDITYPPNYIQRMMNAIKRYDRAAVCVHGWRMPRHPKNRKDGVLLNFPSALDVDTPVSVGGTGSLGFSTADVRLLTSDFVGQVRNAADYHAAAVLASQKIPLMAIRRHAKWLVPRETDRRYSLFCTDPNPHDVMFRQMPWDAIFRIRKETQKWLS